MISGNPKPNPELSTKFNYHSRSSEYGKERLNYLQWEGDWRPDNAKEMFDYIIEQNMEHLFYGFELGNEVWVRRFSSYKSRIYFVTIHTKLREF